MRRSWLTLATSWRWKRSFWVSSPTMPSMRSAMALKCRPRAPISSALVPGTRAARSPAVKEATPVERRRMRRVVQNMMIMDEAAA